MQPLWTPDAQAVARTQLEDFRARVAACAGRALPDYAALHRWSVEERAAFWRLVWQQCGVLGTPADGGERVLENDRMPGARWFGDARLNFARNLLHGAGAPDAREALVFRGEGGARRALRWGELRRDVARVAAAMRAAGLGPGDRVAGFLPNIPEAVVAMLAAASLGCSWSSASPDFGLRGVVDRFGQVAPRWLLCADGYRYGGRVFASTGSEGRVAPMLDALPSVERCVVIPFLGEVSASDVATLRGGQHWDELLAEGRAAGADARPPAFEELPFDHPLYVLFSSGTTGRPKCIVHGAGGTLLKHLEEQRLHVDLRPGERLFYFTTLGWMMWNWLASGLASGATLVLYDGSPFHPEADALFDVAEQERVDVFGVSAKYLDACAKAGLAPARTHDLRRVRSVLSTGSPLAPESFDYVYEKVTPHAHLASISGGTDICGCFVLGNPTAPVWRGEIQSPALGMAVEVFDGEGRALGVGEPGELVCTRAFPSMPLGFLDDPDGRRYHAAYFDRYPGVWHHGDFVARTAHGGFVISGRSDAVLNPGGVRIGTAEIYRQVERLDEVVESIAVGQQWQGDVRVVLFVVLRPGSVLDDALEARIRDAVRRGASPRHVPARIVAVPDIPRTRSGKITELAVRDVVHGRAVANVEALANPEALAHFRDRPELAV